MKFEKLPIMTLLLLIVVSCYSGLEVVEKGLHVELSVKVPVKQMEINKNQISHRV